MQAVAGVVGHAELLCAALSIPAVLLYCKAADAGTAMSPAVHWAHVGGAVLLSWAAALSKEIGITVVGTMLVYDVLLVPLTCTAGVGSGSSGTTDAKNGSTTAVDGDFCSNDKGHSTAAHPAPSTGERKWLRLLVLCVAGVTYVKMRSWVAGDHLVRIYRKVGGRWWWCCQPRCMHPHAHCHIICTLQGLWLCCMQLLSFIMLDCKSCTVFGLCSCEQSRV